MTREQADKLENYVLALGIRGYKKWSEKWVRIYRGMEPDQIQELNEIREVFAEEVRGLAQGFGSGKRTVEEYCRILYDFIVKSQVWQKLKVQTVAGDRTVSGKSGSDSAKYRPGYGGRYGKIPFKGYQSSVFRRSE